jgi:hypothetical protein
LKTIWFGDQDTRGYYEIRTGVANQILFPPAAIPQHPWTAADVLHAQTTQTLPLQRDAVGNQIPAPPAPDPMVYPYIFWPDEPWDAEPARDALTDLTVADIRDFTNNMGTYVNRRTWLGTLPEKWPVQPELGQFQGAKWLEAGTFGVAGMWCTVDAMNNITGVSP